MYEAMFPMLFYKNIDNISTDKFIPLIFQDIMPNYYLISIYGDVYSIKQNKILKPFINRGGYMRICLITINGKRNFSIHRLVASSFILNPFPDRYTDVNHIDGNKNNNFYMNLEWCTNNQNKREASINGLYQHGENRYNSTYSDNFIREICQKFQSGERYIDVYNFYVEQNKYSRNTIGCLIYKIYHRKTRNDIVSQYIF